MNADASSSGVGVFCRPDVERTSQAHRDWRRQGGASSVGVPSRSAMCAGRRTGAGTVEGCRHLEHLLERHLGRASTHIGVPTGSADGRAPADLRGRRSGYSCVPAFDQVEVARAPAARRPRRSRPRSSRSARPARGLRGARRAAARPAFVSAMPLEVDLALGRFATSRQTRRRPRNPATDRPRPALGRAQRGAGVRFAIHARRANISACDAGGCRCHAQVVSGRPAQRPSRRPVALDGDRRDIGALGSAAYGSSIS